MNEGRTRRSATVASVAWLGAGILVVGCVSAIPRVDAGLVRAAREVQRDADAGRLRAGYDAYRSRCAGCHHLVPPANHSADTWPALVTDHEDRLELTDSEVDSIVLYLQAGRLVQESSPADATLGE